MLWIRDVFPDPGAPYYEKRKKGGDDVSDHDMDDMPDVTYEKVTPSERNSALGVPPLAIQEIKGVVEDRLFHTGIEDDGRQRAFRTRSDEAPFISSIGSVD